MILNHSVSVELRSSKCGINRIEIIGYNIICSRTWYNFMVNSVNEIDRFRQTLCAFCSIILGTNWYLTVMVLWAFEL